MTMNDIYIILTIVFFTVVLVTFSIVPMAIGAGLIFILIVGELALSYKTNRSSDSKNQFASNNKFNKTSKTVSYT